MGGGRLSGCRGNSGGRADGASGGQAVKDRLRGEKLSRSREGVWGGHSDGAGAFSEIELLLERTFLRRDHSPRCVKAGLRGGARSRHRKNRFVGPRRRRP